MRIALLGYGTVGKGFHEIIRESFPEHEIVCILVRKTRDEDLFVYDIEKVFERNPDVIVEALTGEDPAFDYCRTSLSRSIPYISANKKMIARHLELFELANKKKTKLLVEASCGGGIPWFSNLKRIRQSDNISQIKGIMNGTSNYILSSIFNKGMNFSDALSKAQELGYAEADPSDDIKGYDTRYKLCISILKAFDLRCEVDDIPCFGINDLKDEDIAYARDNGMVIKLTGKALYKERLQASVMPVFVRKESVLGSVDVNFNLLEVISGNLGKLDLIGQGAGSLPTGFSLVQDLCALNEKEIEHETKETAVTNDDKSKFYLRTDRIDDYTDLIEERINDKSFLSKDCSLDEILKIHEIINDEMFIGEVLDD